MKTAKKPGAGSASGWTPYLLLVSAPLCWAGNVVLARGVVELIPPVSFAFWRWVFAFAVVFPVFFRHAQQDWAVAVRHWKILVLISLLGISCFNTLLYTAVHTTTAINASLIQSAMPAFIILMTLLLYGESVNGLQLLGVGSCILGACIVVLRGNLGAVLEVTPARGDLLMVAAVIVYAGYSTLLRRRPPIRPTSFLVYTFGIGAAGLFPMYVWELATVGPFSVTLPVGMSIVFVALFPSIVAYFGWNRGIDMIGPNRGGLFINLIPVFASAMAVAWLGESLRPYHGVGMALIAGGIIVFNRQR